MGAAAAAFLASRLSHPHAPRREARRTLPLRPCDESRPRRRSSLSKQRLRTIERIEDFGGAGRGPLPSADGLIGDGERMFAVWDDYAPKFQTAKETDPATWSTWTTPSFPKRVAGFAYDPDHHVLYSPHTNDGVGAS